MESSEESGWSSSSEEVAELDALVGAAEFDEDTKSFIEKVQRVWVPGESGPQPPLGTLRQVGRYRIQKAIGRGGFGIVYLADDPLLQREVALKVPILGHLEDTRNRERFLSEARAAAALQHRYVMSIYDAGEVDGVGYIAMRYCPLGTLGTWLSEQKTPLSPRAAAALVRALCEGVAHAHEQNIVHRDLKPANILLDAAPADSPLREFGFSFQPLVSDFGMAKISGWDDPQIRKEHLTRTGTRMGTPCYMPPEHATGRAKESQKSADVYALGVILFELLAGQPPFVGEGDYEVLHQVVSHEPPPLRKFRSGVPRPLERICRKCLEKSPERRYVDAKSLGDDLSRFLAGERIASQPWFDAPFIRRALACALFFLVAASIVVAWWNAPLLGNKSSLSLPSESLPVVDVIAPTRDYATAIQNVLASPAGTTGEDARRALEDPGFMALHGDQLGFEWRYARQPWLRDRAREAHSGLVHAIEYSPDGLWMAETGEQARVDLWDARSETLVARLPVRTNPIDHIVFSRDSRWLAASEQSIDRDPLGVVYGVQVWDLNGFRPIWTEGVQADIGSIKGITFSNDLNWLYLYGSDSLNFGAVWKCHRDTAKVEWKWTSQYGWVNDVVESHEEGEIWLCQIIEEQSQPRKTKAIALKMPTKETRVLLPATPGGVLFARFSPDALHLVIGEHHPRSNEALFELNVHEINSGQRVFQIREPFGSLEKFVFERSTNNLYVVCKGSLEPNANRILRKWDADAGTLNWVRAIPPGSNITAMTIHPSSESVVFRRLEDPRIHYAELNRTDFSEFHGHYPKEAWSAAFSKDGSRLLSGGDDGYARVWDVASGNLIDQFEEHVPQLVTAVAYEPSNLRRVATASFDRTVKIWNSEEEPRSSVTLPHEAVVRNLAFVPGKTSILTLADDLAVRSWNYSNNALEWEASPSTNKLRCVTVHPNGTEVAVAGNDGILRILSPEDGSEWLTAESRASQIWALVYSPADATWIIGTRGGTIERLDRGTSELKVWNTLSSEILALAVSPDGKTLISASGNGEIGMWQLATGSFLGVLDRVGQQTHGLAFSPDGQRLVAALHDGSIRMWSAPDPDTSR
jgi:eukaryotic-like serine/threonine-protein kinase